MNNPGSRPRKSLRALLPLISGPLCPQSTVVQVVSVLCSLSLGCRFAVLGLACTLALPVAARSLRDYSQVPSHTPLLLLHRSQGLYPFHSVRSKPSGGPHLSHSDRLT